MKKGLIISLIIIILAGIFYGLYYIFDTTVGGRSYCISNFDGNKKYFEIMVDKLKGDYKEQYGVEYKKDDTILYKLSDGKDVILTDDEKIALNKIRDIFGEETSFRGIMVYDNRVTFCTDGNWYAIAYMKYDERPEFMSSPTEGFDIRVFKIEEHWYHIVIV